MTTLHYPHIILLGPPGVGKSTFAAELAGRLPLTVVASGANLRREVERGSELGRAVEPLVAQGHFVPDELMDRLMRGWLAELSPMQGVLLDGYPRTLEQASALDRMLAELGRSLDAVIALELAEAELVRRLSGRRICVGGGPSYTLHISDEAALRRCRERGGTLTSRADDQPAVISERLRVYEHETAPLHDYYRRAGLLRPVAAVGSPAQVVDAIIAALGDRARGSSPKTA